MRKNVGRIDASIRMLIALILFGTHIFTEWYSGIMVPIVVAFSVALAITAIASYCPVYNIIGLRTYHAS